MNHAVVHKREPEPESLPQHDDHGGDKREPEPMVPSSDKIIEREPEPIPQDPPTIPPSWGNPRDPPPPGMGGGRKRSMASSPDGMVARAFIA